MQFRYLLWLTISVNAYGQERTTPLFSIIEKDMVGFIDSTGKPMIDPRFHNVLDFSEGLAPARTSGVYGYMDTTGQWVIKPQFDYALSFHDGYAVVWKDGRPFWIDRNGIRLFENSFPAVGPFRNGRALIRTATRKYGIIDLKGRLVADTVYKYMTPTEYDTYIVEGLHHDPTADKRRDIKYEIGIIDTTGKFIVPFGLYKDIGFYKNGLVEVRFKPVHPGRRNEYELTGFLDEKGYLVFKEEDHSAIFSFEQAGEGLLYFHGKGTAGLMDLKGKVIASGKIYQYNNEFSDGRAIVAGEQLSGYRIIDKRGNVCGRDTFDSFLEYRFVNGRAFFQKDEKWGCVDTNGNVLIQPKFDDLINNSAHGDYFFFRVHDSTGSLIGIADYTGSILVPARFQDVDPTGFQHGLLKVFEEGRFGYVDRKGNYVWRQNPGKDTYPLNIDYMNRGYFYATSFYPDDTARSGGWAVSGNSSKAVPDSLLTGNKSFEVILDTTHKARWSGQYEAIKAYIVNRGKDTLFFEAQDSRLYMKMQALDKNGEWKDIEYLPHSWCGNSYHILHLDPKKYWEFNVPVYHGDFRTRIRLQLLYNSIPERGHNKVIYSNVIEGSVNVGQFCIKKEYSPSGIMDPYWD